MEPPSGCSDPTGSSVGRGSEAAPRDSAPSLRQSLKVLFSKTTGDHAYFEGYLAKPLPLVVGMASFRTLVDATNLR